MPTRTMWWRALCCSAMMALAAWPAPSPRRTHLALSPQQTATAGNVRVTLLAYDNKNNVVKDLAAGEIRVLEGKEPRTVTGFTRLTPAPLTVGLLVDYSGSRRFTGSEIEREACAAFMREVVQGETRGFVVGFNEAVFSLSDITADTASLEHAVKNARKTYSGRSAFYDAVFMVSREMKHMPGWKVLVIISDAEDNGSRHKEEEAIEAARDSETRIHIFWQPDKEVGQRTKERSLGNAKRIADRTNGRVWEIRRANEIPAVLQTLQEELAHHYFLSYAASQDGAQPSAKLRIESTRKGVKITVLRVEKDGPAQSPSH